MADDKKRKEFKEIIRRELERSKTSTTRDEATWNELVDRELERQLASEKLSNDLERKYLSMGSTLIKDELPERMDAETREELEPMIGEDLDDVKIHTGEKAQHAAEAMGAKAFTLGDKDIYFAKDQYQPKSLSGTALLAHELTHVYEDKAPAAPALSARQKSGTDSASEQRAVSKEKQVLRREKPARRKDTSAETPSTKADGGQVSEEAMKEMLTEKVWQMMRRSERMSKERTGGF